MQRAKLFMTAVLMAACLTAIGACGGSDDGDDTATAGGGGGDKQQKLRVGMSAALAGVYAAYDQPLIDGMEYAVDEINAKGGIDGVKVELVVKDNKGESSAALTTTQELLDDGVQVHVLSPHDSHIAVGQLVASKGGILDAGLNTSPVTLNDIGERAFSFVFSDNAQASAAAEYACEKGYKTAYTLADPAFPYTRDTPKYFEDAFAHTCDGRVTGKDTWQTGQTEYGSQVTKIKNAQPRPDVIYTPIGVPDSGAFLKQLRAAGVDTPVITADGNNSAVLKDSAGSAAEGLVYTSHGFPEKGSSLEKFLGDFETKTGSPAESNTYEAAGRDAIYTLVEAARRAKSTDPSKMLEEIMALKDFEVLQGNLSMDPKSRFPELEVALLEVKDGTPTLLDRVTPEYVAPAVKG